MSSIARVRSSAVGASILAALAYLLLVGVMWSTGHAVGPWQIAMAGGPGLLDFRRFYARAEAVLQGNPHPDAP